MFLYTFAPLRLRMHQPCHFGILYYNPGGVATRSLLVPTTPIRKGESTESCSLRGNLTYLLTVRHKRLP